MGQVWCQGPVQAELAWRSHSILCNIIYFSFVGEKDKAYRYQMSKVIQTELKSVLFQSLFSFTEPGCLSLSGKINCSSGWPTSSLFQEDEEWLLHGFCKPIRNFGWESCFWLWSPHLIFLVTCSTGTGYVNEFSVVINLIKYETDEWWKNHS